MSDYCKEHPSFPCPICHKIIPWYHIAGNCPYCKEQGFKTLRVRYGICHDCQYFYLVRGVQKCLKKHISKARSSCNDYKNSQEVVYDEIFASAKD